MFGLICVPVGGFVFSLIFGGLIAVVEGWSLQNGIYYMMTNVLVLPGPLTDILPETTAGIWLSLLASTWGLATIIAAFSLINLFEEDASATKEELEDHDNRILEAREEDMEEYEHDNPDIEMQRSNPIVSKVGATFRF